MTREEIIAANPIVDFLCNRGHELKRAGKNFVTNASPVSQHKRGHRPVMIYPENNSWFDHDLKIGGSVIDWVMHERGCDAAQAMRELSGNNGAPEIVATYDYTDEGGNLLFQCVRTKPKDFWQRRPDGKGGWINNLQGVRRVLYRLPEVIAASAVCVPEGEKDCDNLEKLGFVATTNPLGAGKWRDEYSETLRGKDVIVFGDVGDNDGKGENHTQHVIESLTGKAKSIKHVALPDGFHDVSDYIASLPHETAGDTIRKLIDQTPRIEVQSQEAPEPPPPPAPYVPPPLDLLPSVLQDYVHAAAASLNVDVSYILLPMLSSLGAAIGNARSILLKPGFIQPPVIWTAIIGRSGYLKSPALEKGCFAVMAHEHELMRENKKAQEIYENDLAEWKAKKPAHRGSESVPVPPPFLTCEMDDLTIEALSDVLAMNPRGVLVAKDEISHWFASFDQYRSHGKGSDVSRWLSLHSAVHFALDRRTDRRHLRIRDPRANITGGIQPKVLGRVLTPDFFERGLPARFLFAFPSAGQIRWSEATIADALRNAVLDLFEKIWLLPPGHDKHGAPRPELLGLDKHACSVYVAFFDECGEWAIAGDEKEEAAWSKLGGYAARLALVGQVARNPDATIATGNVMAAACDLARWSGKESARIYAVLAETPQQREQRELIEFIRRRGGTVTERDLVTYHRPIKNLGAGATEKATEMLDGLVKAGHGKWDPVPTTPRGGHPTRKFRYLEVSASADPYEIRGKAGSCADADAPNSQKITLSGEPENEPVSGGPDTMPAGILEL